MSGNLPLFVYGTLKAGFPNADACRGRHRIGRFRTCEPMPLWLVGAARLPWLIDDPGAGHHVIGELIDLDHTLLAVLDEFEEVDQPHGYRRRVISVETYRADRHETTSAWAYLKDPAQLHDRLWRLGPLAEYGRQHADLYRPTLE